MVDSMANNKPKKQEALSVSRLINEVLVNQLSIPFRQIVNDTTFSKYTKNTSVNIEKYIMEKSLYMMGKYHISGYIKMVKFI